MIWQYLWAKTTVTRWILLILSPRSTKINPLSVERARKSHATSFATDTSIYPRKFQILKISRRRLKSEFKIGLPTLNFFMGAKIAVWVRVNYSSSPTNHIQRVAQIILRILLSKSFAFCTTTKDVTHWLSISPMTLRLLFPGKLLH